MAPLRPGLTFSHFGIYAVDVDRQADFYRTYLGFTETDRGTLDTTNGVVRLVFLSRDPDEHHQIVFVSGRPDPLPFNTVNQISLRADSLTTLQQYYRLMRDAPVTEVSPTTHGNALSVYFRDPEGNRVELYIDTPWYVSEPCRIAAPMDLPADQLMEWAETHARSLPGFRPRTEWRSEMSIRMGMTTE